MNLGQLNFVYYWLVSCIVSTSWHACFCAFQLSFDCDTV